MKFRDFRVEIYKDGVLENQINFVEIVQIPLGHKNDEFSLITTQESMKFKASWNFQRDFIVEILMLCLQ